MEDKRYRDCVNAIRAVLKRYDMAGAITVVSKERAMFLYHFPTWGVLTLGDDHIRFKSKREDFATKEDQHEATELSAHIVMQMRDIAAQTFKVMNDLGETLATNLGMEHTPGADFDPEVELGPTGDYPRGKLNETDEGGLNVGITVDEGVVKVIFNKPTAWVGLDKASALAFAETIKRRADELKN